MERNNWRKCHSSCFRAIHVSWETLLGLVSIVGGLVSTVWWFRSWFASQFSKIYDRMGAVENNITSKLEYHERHDDQRFQDIHNRVWEVKLQLAGKSLDQELKSRSSGTQTPS